MIRSCYNASKQKHITPKGLNSAVMFRNKLGFLADQSGARMYYLPKYGLRIHEKQNGGRLQRARQKALESENKIDQSSRENALGRGCGGNDLQRS